jgi:hypothetical protein
MAMANLSIIEEVNGSASFNLMVSKEDGQIAWTVTPLSVNDILSDTGLSPPFKWNL